MSAEGHSRRFGSFGAMSGHWAIAVCLQSIARLGSTKGEAAIDGELHQGGHHAHHQRLTPDRAVLRVYELRIDRDGKDIGLRPSFASHAMSQKGQQQTLFGSNLVAALSSRRKFKLSHNLAAAPLHFGGE
jgi:hypothetical protein